MTFGYAPFKTGSRQSPHGVVGNLAGNRVGQEDQGEIQNRGEQRHRRAEAEPPSQEAVPVKFSIRKIQILHGYASS